MSLRKSQTVYVRERSRVMPVEPLHKLFNSWESNQTLSVRRLHIKCITLLALSFMLRPLDIAPKGVQTENFNGTVQRLVFSNDMVTFPEDGGVRIKFIETKNDSL